MPARSTKPLVTDLADLLLPERPLGRRIILT